MKELLKKLLEAEILTESSKVELEAAFEQTIAKAVSEARETTATEVREELAAQWETERASLVEAVDAKVTEFLEAEVGEFKGDVARFRDLEVEAAEKEVKLRENMTKQLEGELAELAETIDAFLEVRLAAEFDELKQDIQEARKLDFGRRMVEAFAQEYQANFVKPGTVEADLKAARQSVVALEAQVKQVAAKNAKLERAAKMEQVLRPLSGRQRDVMEASLSKVATNQLEEGYKKFIGRVLKEASKLEEGSKTEKEGSVLAENSGHSAKLVDRSILKSGDNKQLLKERAEVERREASVSPITAELRRLAGIEQ